jgi:hypothetical protein
LPVLFASSQLIDVRVQSLGTLSVDV